MSIFLLAIAAAAPAPAPAPYHASGNEPGWLLDIAGGRITYDPGDGGPTIVTAARRRPIQDGILYSARPIVVEVRHARCEDDGERYYQDTVRVTANGSTREGCGGAALPPATLADTDWRIVAIDGEAVDGDAYVMQFSADRLDGQAGCNHFSGRYRQAHGLLRPGPVLSTRMACPGRRMEHERRVLHALGGPVHIAFPDGETMVLTGSGSTMRLRRF